MKPATQILNRATHGDEAAAAKLTPLVYDELRRLAAHYLGREAGRHTLQPTAVVHEAFLRLCDHDAATINDREHFLALAATAMRHVLIDHARRRGAVKRGGGRARITLEDHLAGSTGEGVDLLALDDALTRFANLDARAARVVELRYFGGLDDAAVGRILGVSERTVRNDWTMARAWLRRALSDQREDEDREPES
ncbi:MAG: sigma-70 family RNA polymerase sigma factor [Phycisphaerales bacterium]